MERMPYIDEIEAMVATQVNEAKPSIAVEAHWRRALPALDGPSVTLRELRPADAVSLHALLSTEEVAKFISPPPTSVEGYQRFIAWTHRERSAGNYICFGIVPKGLNVAVGLIQVRSLESGFGTAEWGFVLGSAFWGTGIFVEGASCARLRLRRDRRAQARSTVGTEERPR